MKINDVIEGKSPHAKGTKKYKRHMAAKEINNINLESRIKLCVLTNSHKTNFQKHQNIN